MTLLGYGLGMLQNCDRGAAQAGAGARNLRGGLALVSTRRKQSRDDMPERQVRQDGDQIVETTTEARAGYTGLGVRRVLAFGTIGVAILFALIWLYYFS